MNIILGLIVVSVLAIILMQRKHIKSVHIGPDGFTITFFKTKK